MKHTAHFCHRPQAHRERQSGVTLIELMVGLVIGLLATLVIAQVALVFESQKRSTTGSSDAQVSGALALQTLQRDIQMGGYGMSIAGAAGCELWGKRGTVVPPWSSVALAPKPLAPVIITQGASGAADTIDVMSSNTSGFALPMRVFEQHRRDATEFVLDTNTNLGNAVGDLMVAVQNPSPTGPQVAGNVCAVFNVSGLPTVTGVVNGVNVTRADRRIQHDIGANGPWNHDPTGTIFPGTLNADISYGAGSYLINLGTLSWRSYGVAADSTNTRQWLQQRTFVSTSAGTSTEELQPQIVNLQAVYGHDTTAIRDNTVDAWNTTSPTTADGWARMIAVRVVLVARSSTYEKEAVTTAQPTWKPDGSTAETIKVDHLTDWQHYRYKTFEAVVPLRNLLWQS